MFGLTKNENFMTEITPVYRILLYRNIGTQLKNSDLHKHKGPLHQVYNKLTIV